MNYINIAGKDYPISFGFGAIMQYEQATGRPVLALFADFQNNTARFSDIVELIACGMVNGGRKAGGQHVRQYTAEQVADMLDESENPADVLTMAMQLLAQSFEAQDAKKKTVTMQPVKRRKAS